MKMLRRDARGRYPAVGLAPTCSLPTWTLRATPRHNSATHDLTAFDVERMSRYVTSVVLRWVNVAGRKLVGLPHALDRFGCDLRVLFLQ